MELWIMVAYMGLFLVIILLASFLNFRLLVCSSPIEVKILTKTGHNEGQQRARDYRLLTKGWTVRVPLREELQSLSTTVIPVEFCVEDVMAEDEVEISVDVDAFVTIDRHEPGIHHAVEYFLGSSREQIADSAREVLKRHTETTVEKSPSKVVEQDRIVFLRDLHEQVEPELHELGLHLESLHLQRVVSRPVKSQTPQKKASITI